MRVRAIAKKLSGEQRDAIGGTLVRAPLGAPLGAEYLVLGLVFSFNSRRLGTGVWVIHQDEAGNGVMLPLALFEVIDARCSRHWEFRQQSDESATLLPSALYKPNLFEDAADGAPAERSQLAATRALLEEEERLLRAESPLRKS